MQDKRPTDCRMLIVAPAVRQAATRTALVAGRIAERETGGLDPVRALVATFAHVDGTAATRALAGSFHPGVAGARRQPS